MFKSVLSKDFLKVQVIPCRIYFDRLRILKMSFFCWRKLTPGFRVITLVVARWFCDFWTVLVSLQKFGLYFREDYRSKTEQSNRCVTIHHNYYLLLVCFATNRTTKRSENLCTTFVFFSNTLSHLLEQFPWLSEVLPNLKLLNIQYSKMRNLSK